MLKSMQIGVFRLYHSHLNFRENIILKIDYHLLRPAENILCFNGIF